MKVVDVGEEMETDKEPTEKRMARILANETEKKKKVFHKTSKRNTRIEKKRNS